MDIRLCKNCGKELSNKYNIFCNCSCAASFNNKNRKVSIETKIKISHSLQKKNTNFSGEFKPIIKMTRKSNNKINFDKKVYYCLNCGSLISNANSSKTNKYCSNTCQIEYQHKQKYQKILDGDASIMRANYTPFNFKPDILKEQNNKCCICGCEPIHNGKPLVFVLDHIDGNAANNKRDNLRMICPNCDTQLDTFKSKNKNGARHYYRYHKQKD